MWRLKLFVIASVAKQSCCSSTGAVQSRDCFTAFDGTDSSSHGRHRDVVSNGPQQVNNPLAHTGAQARAGAKAHIAQIELSPNLEQNYDLHANDRTPIAAIAANTRHSAVDALDRAEERTR